jgi:3-oxoacyl-[acyl-carrier protein] reductase
VRVNLVVPGFVDTAMTATVSAAARRRIVAAIPAGRIGTAEEIAEVVLSVARSTYMTGAVVPVDGGLLATFGGTG